LIYGQIATSVIDYYINSYYTGKLISYPASEQFKDFLPILSLASLMGFVVFLAGYLPLQNNLVLLFSQVSIGIIFYISLCSLAKIASFVEIRSIALDRYHSLRHRCDNC